MNNFKRYVERRGDKLHFSAFVACMKRSKQEVMMQGKLGVCGGTFLFSCWHSKFCPGRLSLAGKSQTSHFNTHKYTHSLIYLRGLYFIPHLWLLGTWCFCLLFTCTHSHTHIHASACTQPPIHTHTHTDLDQREPWKEAQRQDFSPLLYPSILP